jgi:UDPglucose--hexose-1-phosphate uridylyltransferase
MIAETIKKVIYYANVHLGLNEEDKVYFTNLLLHFFKVNEPFDGEIDEKHIASLAVPDELIIEMVDYMEKEFGYTKELATREAMWVMGILTPNPSVVSAKFNELAKSSPEKACAYLYDLSIKNNYISKSQVDKNLHWDADFKDGPSLEISINLSKPEKNNKDIAKLVNAPASTSYPKCLLCYENLGFAGDDKRAPRENIRFIPLNLEGERWYLQYSPYVYYHQHCICFYEKHVPMEISSRIIKILFAFVNQIPNFFIGSNSDLPIVGGSILNHEHFQGGEHLLPLLVASDKEVISTHLKHTTLSIVNFYDTALRFKGPDQKEIIEAASKLIATWRSYADPAHQIVPKDEKAQHSTVTPLLRKNGKNYELTLILRNNLCTPAYPDGLFHAHPQYHHIKKEGIGLIEAAGLFILPARLLRQAKAVEDIVKRKLPRADYLKLYPDLENFGPMVEEIEATGESVQDYINNVCRHILGNVAVYKNDAEGVKGLHAFLKEVNL